MTQERYAKLEELIAAAPFSGAFKIIEIGVWNGGRAIRMADAAFASGKDAVHYDGYDLFEEITEELNHAELNAKKTQSLEHVTKRLNAYRNKMSSQGKWFSFRLHKGNTRETLGGKTLRGDFAYIDGGHSVETIRNDWLACREIPLVVFDDVYFDIGEDLLDQFGANRILDEIKSASASARAWSRSPGAYSGSEHRVEIYRTGDELNMDDCRGEVGYGIVRKTVEALLDVHPIPDEDLPPREPGDERTNHERMADLEAHASRLDRIDIVPDEPRGLEPGVALALGEEVKNPPPRKRKRTPRAPDGA